MRAFVLAIAVWLSLLSGAAVAQSAAEEILLGVWDVELPNADGTVTTTLEFYDDGTYEGYREVHLKEIGQIIAINGDWSVKDETRQSFELTLAEDGGETLVLEWRYADTAGDELRGAGSNRMTRSDAVPSRDRPRIDDEA